MKESIFISIQVYLIAFVVAILISGMIKGLLGVIRRMTPKDKITEEGK